MVCTPVHRERARCARPCAAPSPDRWRDPPVEPAKLARIQADGPSRRTAGTSRAQEGASATTDVWRFRMHRFLHTACLVFAASSLSLTGCAGVEPTDAEDDGEDLAAVDDSEGEVDDTEDGLSAAKKKKKTPASK